jgi:hypothetical protein
MAEKKVIHVENMDVAKRTSAVNVPENEGTEAAVCYWNGQRYGEGSIICVNHKELICTRFTTWKDTGQKC